MKGHDHEVGFVRVQEQLVHCYVVGHYLVLVVDVLLKDNRITAAYTLCRIVSKTADLTTRLTVDIVEGLNISILGLLSFMVVNNLRRSLV